MQDSNCTFYMDGVPTRGKVNMWGSNNPVWYKAEDNSLDNATFTVSIDAPENDKGIKTITYPGVCSSWIAIDENMANIPESVYDYTEVRRCWYNPWTWYRPVRIPRYKTVLHPVSNWQWRDPDLSCSHCNSINYRPLSLGAYRCLDCDKVFAAKEKQDDTG